MATRTYRASCTNGVFVHTFEPGIAGMAQEATGFGDLSTSTRHMLGRNEWIVSNEGYKKDAPAVTCDGKSVMVAEPKHFKHMEERTSRTSCVTHLGIVAPAASHAWIRAEPVRAMINSS
jgi:hypothetical protein